MSETLIAISMPLIIILQFLQLYFVAIISKSFRKKGNKPEELTDTEEPELSQKAREILAMTDIKDILLEARYSMAYATDCARIVINNVNKISYLEMGDSQ